MSKQKVGILGYSQDAFIALQEAGVAFVAVVPPDFTESLKEANIEFYPWKFEKINEQSITIAKDLAAMGVEVAVPLYEETVEWAGFLNSHFRDDPRLFNRYGLFRNKALMKRKAQMAGIRVGAFEEVDNKDQVKKFFKRVNEALLKLDGEAADPIHLKPLDAAGCKGHRMIKSIDTIEEVREDEFPCLIESHLDGQEFSCEVFIHQGKIQFLNITEYVKLGHSNFIPCSRKLNEKRPLIKKAVEELIEAFGIEYGMIHPEWFITSDNKIGFGEVAARVPGGHMFELIKKTYKFDPYVGFVLCSCPKTAQEELDQFFPREDEHDGYAGCLMVYPKRKVIHDLKIPEVLLEDEYYDYHNLFVPATTKVSERVAYGDHYGTIFFNGKSDQDMHERLEQYEKVDYYV